MPKQYKIVILILPFWGHVNPVSGLACELTKNSNTKIIFYGNKEHKAVIEASGSEFRLYSYYPAIEYMDQLVIDKNDDIVDILDGIYFMDITNKILIELVNMVDEEKPDLIIYDNMSVPTKYLIEYLNNRHKSNKTKYQPAPASFMFSTTFPLINNLYPNKAERNIAVQPKFSLRTFIKGWFYIIFTYIKQIHFIWKFGFRMIDPFEIIFSNKDCELNIVSVFPEFQPRHHLFDKSIKFVGSTISENVRNADKIEDSNLISILQKFKPINPLLPLDDDYYLSNDKLESDMKLIYASLGTTFNNNIGIYLKLLDSFKNIDKEEKSLLEKMNYDSTKYYFVVVGGNSIYESLQERIGKKLLSLPENIFIFRTVPQIEILKRSSLFVTHSGMNSASEAVHYGVPVVCLPLNLDQPAVAYRLTDELGFGIRLDTTKVTSKEITKAVCQVLADKSYQERILRYSQISRRYNGSQNAAKLVYEFIDSKKKKTQ